MNKLNRRTVLRGLGGISLGLPWLEATAQSGFTPKNVRLAWLYFPNGVVEEFWTPGKGSLKKLPKSLAPLEPLKGMVNVHSGLGHGMQYGHPTATANLLSGATIKKGLGEFKVGKSADQLAAEYLGKYTPFNSIELSLTKGVVPGLDHGYNRTMGTYISWSDEKTPVPRERIPLNAYTRLFKGSKKSVTTPEETKSLLDFIKDDAIALKRSLGREDLYRIDQYFSSVRSLEKRIQKATASTLSLPRDAQKPKSGIPKDTIAYTELMLDIMVLAFQTNRTKVASLMLGEAFGNGLDYGFLGVEGDKHELSHHKNIPEKVEKVERIVRHHVSTFAKFLLKLKAVKEGDRTLLDNSLVFMGSDLWSGDTHHSKKRPILVGGKGGGNLKTGHHFMHSEGTKLNNLYVGILKTAGCPINKFGNSTGALI